jgi:hypothetical protein
VITIIGDYKRSIACATAGSNLAETLIIAEEKKRLKRAVEIAETVMVGTPLPGMTNPSGGTSFQVAKEVKKVPLDEVFPRAPCPHRRRIGPQIGKRAHRLPP